MIAVRVLGRLSRSLNALCRIVLVPLVLFFVGVVFVAVLSRYVLDDPIIESVELTRIGFNWSCFVAATIGVKEMAHIRLTFLFEKLPAIGQTACLLLVNSLMAIFFALMLVQGWALFEKVKGTVFPALDWSQGLLYIPLPLAGAIMLVHALSAMGENFARLLGWESAR